MVTIFAKPLPTLPLTTPNELYSNLTSDSIVTQQHLNMFCWVVIVLELKAVIDGGAARGEVEEVEASPGPLQPVEKALVSVGFLVKEKLKGGFDLGMPDNCPTDDLKSFSRCTTAVIFHFRNNLPQWPKK
ncbi:hypothetical protein CJ030_MR3G026570 [Morella rubra]|uniref:Uncharacterized protein n=1 Tax=Morella rubra TaxID=262757 RepID=A0A6A1W7D4_9ROSI|nr:hypothetical protein CJ030_MR3G026570 [Morella rubra]